CPKGAVMNKHAISVILADDHPLLLKGLYEELVANKFNVVGQATNGMQALELILKLKPDVALLDIDMPLLTGFDVIKMAKDKGVSTRFIVLSFHRETEYITQAKALQINGYLLKEDSYFEIERCIESVMNGRDYYSSSFETGTMNMANVELKRLQLLTPSERTILKLVAQQATTSDIASELGVSKRTVEKHRSNIITKLELEGGTNTLTNWSLVNKNTILEL
ncbi:MAG: response regulator transcription factor, partial [Bacteroidota bacterium]